MMEVVEEAVMESMRSLCNQMIEESKLDRCWEEIETSRMTKEVENGGQRECRKWRLT